jgi:hypothetical protein
MVVFATAPRTEIIKLQLLSIDHLNGFCAIFIPAQAPATSEVTIFWVFESCKENKQSLKYKLF